jgi:hypothetical protein
MCQRGVVNDNEWAGWLRWMKTVFERSLKSEIWKTIELEKWSDYAFEEFVDKDLSPELS